MFQLRVYHSRPESCAAETSAVPPTDLARVAEIGDCGCSGRSAPLQAAVARACVATHAGSDTRHVPPLEMVAAASLGWTAAWACVVRDARVVHGGGAGLGGALRARSGVGADTVVTSAAVRNCCRDFCQHLHRLLLLHPRRSYGLNRDHRVVLDGNGAAAAAGGGDC